MVILRGVLSIVGVAIAAVIVWAMLKGDFAAALDAMAADPWGILALADLYLGLLLIGIVIAIVERSWTAAIWIVPLPVLGNLWALIWLVARLPVFLRKTERES